MQSHEISKGHHYRVSLQIMFNDIQPHLARKEGSAEISGW